MTQPEPSDSLARALQRQYGGSVRAPVSWRAQLGEVRASYASNRAMARGLGVDERTIRRWLSGSATPRAGTAGKLASAAQELRASRFTFTLTSLSFDQHMGRDQRQRRATASGLNWDRTQDAVVTRHIRNGDWVAAANAIRGGIRDPFYASVFGAQDDLFDAPEYGTTANGVN